MRKQEELGEPWCPQGDYWVLWTSADVVPRALWLYF